MAVRAEVRIVPFETSAPMLNPNCRGTRPGSASSHSGGGRAKTQAAAQLLADREPLLRCQNHSGMFSPSTDPLRVKAIEIRHVERVEDTPMFCGKGQLFVVRLLDQASVQNRDRGNATRTK